MSLARSLVESLPPGLAKRARASKRQYRRVRYRLREAVKPVRIDREAIAGALREAGLGPGDDVFFQSAMSSFGEIVDGPQTVIAALEDVVGEEGLIAMPAFPIVGKAFEYLSSDPVFDVRATPSTMGAITETFRRQQRTVRSLHPTHSVSARGVGGYDLVAGHERAATPFGAGTPYARLIERDAWQVWFGCGIRAFTTYHSFECLRGHFPISVFADRSFSVRCVDSSGRECTVRTLVHDPNVSDYRIDRKPAVAEFWRSLLLERKVLRSVNLGRGEILSVRLRDLMAELERLLHEGITIYELPVPPDGAAPV
jgi:aminoglycoside 3-N-acetyltransferase